MITQKELKKVLHYEPTTGIFTWKVYRNYNAKVGDTAGSLNKASGYIRIRIYSRLYEAHRLAWLYMEGYFPEHDIDHRFRIRSDNRWSELRHVSKQCNSRNCKIRSDNKSGVTGISWYKPLNKWVVRIGVNNKQTYLGHFTDFDEAVIVRWEAEVEYGFPNCNTVSSANIYLIEKGLITK